MSEITRDRTSQEGSQSSPPAPVSREEFEALREKVAAQAHTLWWYRTLFRWFIVVNIVYALVQFVAHLARH